eukprot:CAMPEP_0118915274 /NCGR_PEP_ID=MMETSP1166-20130328/15458_1 /TAXON_ID=1104430 /ORGANISM="Chrysoreinhardia sp, Strain CCMP3193" /LENGTH=217 /DNA_ID=CAMNT_0006854937 /DNA_START=1 /DNA_END=651 /DNA_ORIENTATION=+
MEGSLQSYLADSRNRYDRRRDLLSQQRPFLQKCRSSGVQHVMAYWSYDAYLRGTNGVVLGLQTWFRSYVQENLNYHNAGGTLNRRVFFDGMRNVAIGEHTFEAIQVAGRRPPCSRPGAEFPASAATAAAAASPPHPTTATKRPAQSLSVPDPADASAAFTTATPDPADATPDPAVTKLACYPTATRPAPPAQLTDRAHPGLGRSPMATEPAPDITGR